MVAHMTALPAHYGQAATAQYSMRMVTFATLVPDASAIIRFALVIVAEIV
jgi:hypothetical protein